jgi:hypothetical protein
MDIVAALRRAVEAGTRRGSSRMVTAPDANGTIVRSSAVSFCALGGWQ